MGLIAVVYILLLKILERSVGTLETLGQHEYALGSVALLVQQGEKFCGGDPCSLSTLDIFLVSRQMHAELNIRALIH